MDDQLHTTVDEAEVSPDRHVLSQTTDHMTQSTSGQYTPILLELAIEHNFGRRNSSRVKVLDFTKTTTYSMIFLPLSTFAIGTINGLYARQGPSIEISCQCQKARL